MTDSRLARGLSINAVLIGTNLGGGGSAPDPGAPQVPTLTAPADNAVLSPGDSVTLSATSPDGDLTRIDWVLDPTGPGTGGTVIATDSSSPYSQPWTVAGSFGAHTIVARAVRGTLATDSAAIDITIYSPANIANVLAWYRADTEVSGSPVATWGNGAGASLDVTQGTGSAQPTLVATDARFNNKPAIEFDGTADFLAAALAADWKDPHDGTGGTVMIVFHQVSAASGNDVPLDTLGGSTSNIGFELIVDGTNQRITTQVSNGVANLVLHTSANGSCLKAATHIYCFAYGEGASPNEYEIRLDGVELTSGNSAAAPSTSNPFGALHIGRFVPAGGGFFQGAIAEVVIVAGRLTTAELQTFEAYAARYAA